MDVISKEELNQLIKRDKKSCRIFYDKYKAVLFGICMRYAKNRQDAQDIMQEGFVEIFNALDAFNHLGSFEGYIKRIMVRKAIAFVKKYYRVDFAEIQENYQISYAKVHEKIDEDSLLEIINAIPEKYKLIFNLRAIEAYSSKEVSDLLSINEVTVRSQFHRAKKLIQDQIIKLNKSEENTINYGF